MVRHQTGDEPLPEPMMTQFSDAYVTNEVPMISEPNIILEVPWYLDNQI